MNKTKLLSVMSIVCLLTACNSHEHTFSKGWAFDENQHWHPALCDHKDEKSEVENHELGTAKEVDDYMVQTCKCGYEKKAPVPYAAGDIAVKSAAAATVNAGLTITSTFTNTVEIHTQKQKDYLSYNGEYKTIPTTSYPDGNVSISDPVKTNLAWNYTGSDVKNYSVTISQSADFSGGFTINGTTATSMDIYNLYLGKNYVRVNATLNDNTKICSATTEINVDSTYPRNLYVGPMMTNCRDCGGRSLVGGGTIRQGVLYRTCGNGYNMDNKKVDDEGKRIMLEELGFKTEINLSDNSTYNFKLTGTKVVDTLMDYSTSSNPSRHHFSRNTENVKNVFNLLANPDSYPVYFHCRIGTDRTGLVAILINGLLGVDLNEIYQDYLFSNFGKIGSKRYIGSQAGDDNILNYMNEIEAMPGASFQEKTYNTLLSIGVARKTLDKVIDLLTVGTKSDNNKGQIRISAKNMIADETEIKEVDKSSGTERSNPESYATLTKDAMVTAYFSTANAGNKEFYAYLGNSDPSTSKKISDSIKVYIDDEEIAVNDINFSNAGMGKCGSRTNYYFVKLNKDAINLTAGSHNIQVVGVANDMNIGTITIF